MTEKVLQAKVMHLARMLGWTVVHFHDSRRALPGGRTVGDSDAKGWPDLVLIHSMTGRILFRELKSDARTAKVTLDQQTLLNQLSACGLNAGVWRPADWPTIATTLRRAA